MHKKPPHNPYEPSVRERLVQRDNALRARAYTATGKRKYAVSKQITQQELENVWAHGHSIYYKIHGNTVTNAPSRYILVDYESYGPAKSVEQRWLTEQQATMLRLKGFIVNDIL